MQNISLNANAKVSYLNGGLTFGLSFSPLINGIYAISESSGETVQLYRHVLALDVLANVHPRLPRGKAFRSTFFIIHRRKAFLSTFFIFFYHTQVYLNIPFYYIQSNEIQKNIN